MTRRCSKSCRCFGIRKGVHPCGEIIRDLIKLRKQNPAFRNDRVVWLRNSDEVALVTLMRLDAQDEFVVVIVLFEPSGRRLGRTHG